MSFKECLRPWSAAIPRATIFTKYLIGTLSKHQLLANMAKQTAIHNSIVIKKYNNNPITQQPRVPFPPGLPQQQPRVSAPPLTRSRARAASVGPAPLVTPAPVRALHSILRHTQGHAILRGWYSCHSEKTNQTSNLSNVCTVQEQGGLNYKKYNAMHWNYRASFSADIKIKSLTAIMSLVFLASTLNFLFSFQSLFMPVFAEKDNMFVSQQPGSSPLFVGKMEPKHQQRHIDN